MTHYPYMRHASGKVDWETPQELFDKLNTEFHLTHDVAATRENTKCSVYTDESSNGLKGMWIGRIWCNPPYGNQIKDWVKKASEEIQKDYCDIIVMLLPSRTDTKWFHDYVYQKHEVRFIKGRVKFSNGGSAPFPSMIAIFRNDRT